MYTTCKVNINTLHIDSTCHPGESRGPVLTLAWILAFTRMTMTQWAADAIVCPFAGCHCESRGAGRGNLYSNGRPK